MGDENRAADRNLIGRAEFAAGIYVEDGDGIRQVVGDDHPAIVGEGEEPRPLAPAWGPLARGEAAFRADVVNRQGVVAPVGDVEVASVPAHVEMGGVAVAGEIGGKGGDGLDLGQRPVGLRPERYEGIAEFVEEVNQAVPGQYVPWP